MDCVDILANHFSEPWIRECRVKMAAVGCDALGHFPIEFVVGPRPDAGFGVRRYIRRINRSKWRLQRTASGQHRAVLRSVAALAVAGRRKVFAALDLREGALLRVRSWRH